MHRHVDHGALVAERYEIVRSPKWAHVQKLHLEKHPYCVACGPYSRRKTRKQVHHIFPFHYCIALDRPDLELDERNLITLCSSGPNHHLLVGHLDDFESANLNVIRDARRRFHGMSSARIRESLEWDLATLTRLTHLSRMSSADTSRLQVFMRQVELNRSV